ncbi:hypothetical protein HYY75_05125 [bacterium]|nr:hypothetical protein [bacterium]
MSKRKQVFFNKKFFLLAVVFWGISISSIAEIPGIPSAVRTVARLQAINSKSGGDACLSLLINHDSLNNASIKKLSGSIRPLVGGRNFTAADVDFAEVPFTTANGIGLTNLYHDGGEWPNTGGNPARDDGRPSFGVDWAGEFYDLDKNNHYPKAVLRYIGSHCYIFVPAMFFPTLSRGISGTEDTTPAAKPEWNMTWPDTNGWGGEVYYYAPASGVKTLEPRFVFGTDKNLARLKIKEFADEFDGKIYSQVREYFGTEPDIDQDAKIFILLDDIRDGVGSFRGYFWSGNQFPRTQVPSSNEKEMLYIDLFPTFVLNPTQGYRTTAHEFSHMIHFNEGTQVVNGVLKEEERWIDEGVAQYASYVYDKSHTTNLDEFIKVPDTILVEPRVSVWLGSNPFANYGASYLFIFYLMEHYGGTTIPTFMRNLIRDKTAGIESVNNSLKGFNTTFTDVFADWAIANFLDKTRKLEGSPLNDGKWGYAVDNDFDTTNNLGVNQSLPVKFSERVILGPNGAVRSANVNPWAADYIEISGNTGNLNLGFDGDDRTTFKTAVIKRGPKVDPSVEYIYLNSKQAGNLVVQNYGAGNSYENVVLVPMVTATANYEKMNYTFSGTFADLKVGLFPNPIFENEIHVVVRTPLKFSAAPRVQMTFNGEQGYLVMTPVNDSTYITNYHVKSSGEGLVEAFGTNTNGTILTNSIRFTAVFYPPKSSGLLTAAFGTISVPEGALKTGGLVILAIQDTQTSFRGVSRVTPTLDVGLPVSKAQTPIKIKIPLQGSNNFPPEQLGLFEESEGGPKWIGKASVESDFGCGEISKAGRIFVAADSISPSIASQGIEAEPGLITVGVTEEGSGIEPKSVIVSYGNENLFATFDESTKRLMIKVGFLPRGTYNFDLMLSDRLGNATRATVSAKVASTFGLSQIITYPNPAKTFAKLRCSLVGAAGTAGVQATIRDSSGEEVFSTSLKNLGAGVFETTWDLTNRERDRVSNGVYIVEIEASDGSGEIRKRGKIAVIR